MLVFSQDNCRCLDATTGAGVFAPDDPPACVCQRTVTGFGAILESKICNAFSPELHRDPGAMSLRAFFLSCIVQGIFPWLLLLHTIVPSSSLATRNAHNLLRDGIR